MKKRNLFQRYLISVSSIPGLSAFLVAAALFILLILPDILGSKSSETEFLHLFFKLDFLVIPFFSWLLLYIINYSLAKKNVIMADDENIVIKYKNGKIYEYGKTLWKDTGKGFKTKQIQLPWICRDGNGKYYKESANSTMSFDLDILSFKLPIMIKFQPIAKFGTEQLQRFLDIGADSFEDYIVKMILKQNNEDKIIAILKTYLSNGKDLLKTMSDLYSALDKPDLELSNISNWELEFDHPKITATLN